MWVVAKAVLLGLTALIAFVSGLVFGYALKNGDE
jgi:hypothetical protein